VLDPDLNWTALLHQVIEQGAGFAAGAIDPPGCDALAAELSGGPFVPVAPVIGQVRQQLEAFRVPVKQLPLRYPLLAELCDELIIQIQPGRSGLGAERDQLPAIPARVVGHHAAPRPAPVRCGRRGGHGCRVRTIHAVP
jgi:hypothetical protein